MSRVADPLGDSSAPSDPGGVEGILEKHGYIKLFPAKREGQPFPSPKALMFALIVVNQDTIGTTLSAIQIRHPRARQDDDFGIWPAAADRPQRRNGHDRIAYPICRPNEDFHACVIGCVRPTVARTAAQKASSSLSAKSILHA